MIIKVSDEFFNVKDTLECGQIFRFSPYKEGYIVHSLDRACYVYNKDKCAYIECEDKDREYFYNYFDLDRDYSKIYNEAINSDYNILSKCAKLGKGIRILNQDKKEMLYSFIVSQNNNIPRIKGIIERLCLSAGVKKNFLDTIFYSFPVESELNKKSLDFFYSIGLGYRAPYIKKLSQSLIESLDLCELEKQNTEDLKKSLLSIYGVGPKVADCVALFGFHRSDSFPVDTWIEKVYKEDFNGELTDRKKIAKWFTEQFKGNSGYFQQYLFYYKRSNLEEKR